MDAKSRGLEVLRPKQKKFPKSTENFFKNAAEKNLQSFENGFTVLKTKKKGAKAPKLEKKSFFEIFSSFQNFYRKTSFLFSLSRGDLMARNKIFLKFLNFIVNQAIFFLGLGIFFFFSTVWKKVILLFFQDNFFLSCEHFSLGLQNFFSDPRFSKVRDRS